MSLKQTSDPISGLTAKYRIALLGAESSGKTTLAAALTAALRDRGYNAGMVPEYLRIWCEENSRLPEFDDQDEILEGQLALEDAASTQFDVIVCDPAAITTGFYSLEYFGTDRHLEPQLLNRYDQVFLCDIDFPWQPDPLRDSENVRERMHTSIVAYLEQAMTVNNNEIPLLSQTAPQRLALALSLLTLPGTKAWQPLPLMDST
jgi:nicotinamide riboside kinase